MAGSILVADASITNGGIRLAFEEPLHKTITYFREMSTILMVTNPRYIGGKLLTLSNRSRVIVNPEVEKTAELKVYFHRHVPQYHKVLDDKDIEQLRFIEKPEHLITLATLETMISQNPTAKLAARVSVLIASADFVALWERHSLFYTHCNLCSSGDYSKRYWDFCDCGLENPNLVSRVNPHVIAAFSDETCGFKSSLASIGSEDMSNGSHGSQSPIQTTTDINVHPLLVSDSAFRSLTGRTPMDLCDHLQLFCEADARDELQRLEKALEWKRVIFQVVWTGDAPSVEGRVSSLDSTEVEGHVKHEWTCLGRLILLDVEVLEPICW